MRSILDVVILLSIDIRVSSNNRVVCHFFVKAPPMPAFWATLVEVWSAVFLVDMAAYLFCRPIRFALPEYVCRALLYDGIFWLTKLGLAAVVNIVKESCLLDYYCTTSIFLCSFRGCFLICPTLLLKAK